MAKARQNLAKRIKSLMTDAANEAAVNRLVRRLSLKKRTTLGLPLSPPESASP